MNNEEKILEMLVSMQSDISNIKEDIEALKEDSTITRGAVNSLVEWADNVAIITGQRFPVKKSAKVAE